MEKVSIDGSNYECTNMNYTDVGATIAIHVLKHITELEITESTSQQLSIGVCCGSTLRSKDKGPSTLNTGLV